MCKNNGIPKLSTEGEQKKTSSSNHSPTSVMVDDLKECSTKQSWKNKNDASTNQIPAFLEVLPQSQQFVILSCSMFLFFGAHNLLQEAIMKVPGFEHGVMLSYMEVLG
jgi:hypothetical protein